MSVAIVATATTAIVGVSQAVSARKAGKAAREQGNQNADELLSLATRNNELSLGAARFNAGMTLQVANANASAIERNSLRNAELITKEYEEELRRHIRTEKNLAGSIRANSSASGVSVNSGTPLMFLSNELDESERERDFIAERGTLTVFNYLTQEQEKADLIRLEGSLNASAIMFNAQTEAEIYLNEQVGVANATRQQGKDAYRHGRDQSNSILFNTALNAGASYYDSRSKAASRGTLAGNSAGQSRADNSGVA